MIPSADSSSPPSRLLSGASLDLRPGSISTATQITFPVALAVCSDAAAPVPAFPAPRSASLRLTCGSQNLIQYPVGRSGSVQ